MSFGTIKEESDLRYCLGKAPARPEGVKLHLRDYIKPYRLPAPPENFGHESLVPDWGMLANDKVGDCAIAGPFHALQLWCAEGKKPIEVNDDCVLKAYSAVTGYDPDAYNPWSRTNPTDNGSNVLDVAEYWRTTGFTDAAGRVHKIDTYLALEPKNVEQLFQALYLFDGVGIGIDCPAEYMDAFDKGQAWDSLKDPHVEGGHFILGLGRRGGMINTVTWGRTQLFTAAGYEQFSDEAFVYFDSEKLINGKNIDGFDAEQLIADLAGIAQESEYEPPGKCEVLV
jgi:hypothetical protein